MPWPELPSSGLDGGATVDCQDGLSRGCRELVLSATALHGVFIRRFLLCWRVIDLSPVGYPV